MDAFKVILNYVVSSRPATVAWDAISNSTILHITLVGWRTLNILILERTHDLLRNIKDSLMCILYLLSHAILKIHSQSRHSLSFTNKLGDSYKATFSK